MKKLISLFLLICTTCYAQWTEEVISESPRIMIVHNFLSSFECDYLIAIARPHLQPALVVDEEGQGGSQKTDPGRTSLGMFLDYRFADPFVAAIEKRLSDLTHFPRENGEPIQILFYGLGGEYRPHYDAFNPDTTGGAEFLKWGGQRIASVIMYLNTPEEGGATIFPLADKSVKAEKGKAVFFYNCLPSGEIDNLSFHGGAPVLKGEKWIATRWLRERKFE